MTARAPCASWCRTRRAGPWRSGSRGQPRPWRWPRAACGDPGRPCATRSGRTRRTAAATRCRCATSTATCPSASSPRRTRTSTTHPGWCTAARRSPTPGTRPGLKQHGRHGRRQVLALESKPPPLVPQSAAVLTDARPRVVGHLPALRARAGPARERRLALVLAAQRRAARGCCKGRAQSTRVRDAAAPTNRGKARPRTRQNAVPRSTFSGQIRGHKDLRPALNPDPSTSFGRPRGTAWALLGQQLGGQRTAGRLLVGAIRAVALLVAQLGAQDALGRAVRPALGAEELVLWTGRGRAVELVRPVRAVPVAVAVERHGDAQRIGAPELAHVARWEVCNRECKGGIACTSTREAPGGWAIRSGLVPCGR